VEELTPEQLGFEAHIRRTFVSLLDVGQQQPTLTTILKLSKALRTPKFVLNEFLAYIRSPPKSWTFIIKRSVK